MPGHTYRPRTADQLAEEFAERAAIKQYEGGMSREQAEREARAEVYGGR